jgi:hypothetical protein
VRFFRAGDDQEPRRVPVEAVDDSRPLGLLPARHRVPEEPVDERAARVASRRVDDDPGRFVDDQQVLVLEGDAQIELLRLERRRPTFRDADREHVARRQAVALRLRRAVDLHPALGEQALGRRTRADLLEAGEKAVQALARRLRRDFQLQLSQASSERLAPKECA